VSDWRAPRRRTPARARARLLFAFVGALSPLLAAEPERARGAGALRAGEVGRDLGLVEKAWTGHGELTILSPRLLVRGASLELPLPAAAVDGASASCATLLVLATKNSVFSLAFEPTSPALRGDFPLTSSLGLLEISRCGARKATLATAALEATSPRVVVSMLVLVGQAAPPTAVASLPERHAGDLGIAPELGPRPALGPLPERLAVKERALASSQPSAIVDDVLTTDEMGHARRTWSLAAGCHTLDVLDASEQAGLTDVDARMVSSDGEMWAVDTSVAPDASLSFCLGEPRLMTLDVRGGSPQSSLGVLQATWPLPEPLPAQWGARVRGRLADALREVPSRGLGTHPIHATLGVQGSTRLSVQVKPGACYVAAVAALDRPPERIGLAGRAGGVVSQTRARGERTSAAITVCATAPSLSIDVQSVGAGAGWLLAVWELGKREPS